MMHVSEFDLPLGGQVLDDLVGRIGLSAGDEGDAVGVTGPECPGDAVLIHVQLKNLPAVGSVPHESDDLSGLVGPESCVVPSIGGGADGVDEIAVSGDALDGGGHCLVLSISGWRPVLPADNSIVLPRALRVNPHGR